MIAAPRWEALSVRQEALTQLELRLHSCLGPQIHHLHVVARSDGIELRGYSRTYLARLLAEDFVREATNGVTVHNHIIVC